MQYKITTLKTLFAVLFALLLPVRGFAADTPEQKYMAVQRSLASGWNTWDTRSVLTHVYLPYGFAVDLNLIDADGKRANRFLIGLRGADDPQLKPYSHTYDGTFTKIGIRWHGYDFTVETSAVGTKNFIVVKPRNDKKGLRLVVVPKALWGRGVTIEYGDRDFLLAPRDKSVPVRTFIKGSDVRRGDKEYTVSLDSPVAVCCGEDLSIAAADSTVNARGEAFVQSVKKKYGNNYDCFNGMQTILGWNSIYDPGIRRVITPVSRIWSSTWFASTEFGGFCLFCWDTYFAGMMLGVENKALAYANVVEITKAVTESGFVPNCYYSNGFKSRDRSQPPVGSMAVWTLYRKYGDRWLLEYLYDDLLSWNTWWTKNRVNKGLLSFGSTPYEKQTYFRSEYDQNTPYAGGLESGLDNSPMFDGVTFNKQTHMQEQNDVGLTSLFIMDCKYLAKIADELGKTSDAQMLRDRAKTFTDNLSALWDEKNGFYYNRSTLTGKPNMRTSPTNFYPLLAGATTNTRAKRMIKEHLLDPKEFWGEYVIPATPRNDPAFKDNEYWRGRIWAPLNFLVYLGLRNYDFPKVRHEFAEKSKNLFLKSWLTDGYVFENYNATTGRGDDTLRSDKYYHWGALLGYISLIENGVIDIE